MSETNPLPPGPELDRLMAEKVMRWEMSGGVWWSKDRNTVEANPCWSPSTSIADAKEIMDHFGALMWKIEGPDMDGRWFATVFTMNGPADGHGDTIEHSICLAALAALTKEPTR